MFNKCFEYTKANILKLVNSLGCSFDEFKILNHPSPYRVHSEIHNQYNYSDEFVYEHKKIERTKQIEKHFKDLEKSEGKEYPNFSLWYSEENKGLLHLLRHFNGYNKHWSIRCDCDNWLSTITECYLGRYGC